MSVAQEIGRWSFLEKLGSQVQCKGRQNLNVMPPVDAAALRAGVADGSIKFRDAWRGTTAAADAAINGFGHRLRRPAGGGSV